MPPDLFLLIESPVLQDYSFPAAGTTQAVASTEVQSHILHPSGSINSVDRSLAEEAKRKRRKGFSTIFLVQNKPGISNIDGS